MWPVVSRIAAYVGLVTAPVIASAVQRRSDGDPFLTELGTRFGLLGLSVLAMQFVVSARIRWVERRLGLDHVYRFHKAMAVLAVALLASHPFLVAAGNGHWGLLTSLDQDRVFLLGKLALALLLVLAAVSLMRAALRLEFQKWRLAHNAAAVTILAIGFFHGFTLSDVIEELPTRLILAAIAATGVISYINHVVLTPALARRHAYTVTQVKQETPDVWTIEMVPQNGRAVPQFLPGQFHFLTLYRECGPPAEEHPFTISSSPTQSGYLASTIKESGDFTGTIGSTRPGDRARIQGPFGRFSYLSEPACQDLVFISGGIGITPLMSMLRHMRDTAADVDVQLLCFNRTEQDIAFRNELAEIESEGRGRLRVTHVLSAPDESWQGETGFPDRDKLIKLIGARFADKAYYVCGPPAMMRLVVKALRGLRVQASHIHYERFSL